MASILVAAIGKAAPLIAKASALCVSPGAAPEQHVTFDKGAERHLKSLLPGSLLKMKDGTHMSVPAKKAATFGTIPKLYARADGAIQGATATEVDTSLIHSVILGVLTDPLDATVHGSQASLTVRSLQASLRPVVEPRFTSLLLELQGSQPVLKPIDEAVRICGLPWRAWGRAAPVLTLLVVGLPTLPMARDVDIEEEDVVGLASAFTPGRRACLTHLGILVPENGGTYTVGGAGGASPPMIAKAGFLADFVTSACDTPVAADAVAGALAAVASPVVGSGAAAAAAHAAARATGHEILEAIRGIVDALDVQSVRWMLAQRAALVADGLTVGGAQLGALARRAPDSAAAEAAALALATPLPLTTPAHPLTTPEVFAAQVAAILATQGLATALTNYTPAGRAATGPLAPGVSPIPIFGLSTPPPATAAPPAVSPFPAIDTLAYDTVTDEASAVAALTELGNGDPQRLCDALAKLEADVGAVSVHFNFGSLMALPIEEQLADVEARLSAMMSVTAATDKQLFAARPASWAAARQRLGLLTATFAHSASCRSAQSTSLAAGPSSALPDAPTRKPPGDTFCSPKSAGIADRPASIAAKVLDAAMGDECVLADAAAAVGVEHSDECERLRTAFPAAAGPYLISNGLTSGVVPGKRGEGKLPIRLERARESTRDRVLAVLQDAVTEHRIDEVRTAVEACAEHVACLDLRAAELVRFFGGTEPGGACAMPGSAGAGRFGCLDGGTAEADNLAIADIRLASPRIDVVLEIVLVETLGQPTFGTDTFTRFVAKAAASLDLTRLKKAVDGFFGRLRSQAVAYRSTVGAPPPNAVEALRWARDEFVGPLAYQQAGTDAAIAAATAAAMAAVARAPGPGSGARNKAQAAGDAKPAATKATGKRQRNDRGKGAASSASAEAAAAPASQKRVRWGPASSIVDEAETPTSAKAALHEQAAASGEAGTIARLGRIEGGAAMAWEQYLGESHPEIAVKERPCFWHFCVTSRPGEASACSPERRSLTECDRSHEPIPAALRSSLAAGFAKVRGACTAGCRRSLKDKVN